MMDSRDISAIRIEFRGDTPPHEFTLTVEGFCRELVDDLTLRVVNRCMDALPAELAAALERAVFSVVRSRRRFEAGKRVQQQTATSAAIVEDIEI